MSRVLVARIMSRERRYNLVASVMHGFLSSLRFCLCRRSVSLSGVKTSTSAYCCWNTHTLPNIVFQNHVLKKRYLSFCTSYGNIHISKSHVELRNNTGSPLHQFNYIWLRDHCRCEKCYNHTTNQRKLNILDIPTDIEPESYSVKDELLHITWPDGHHSQYPLSWLKENTYSNYYDAQKSKWIPWNKGNVNTCGVAKVDLKEYSQTQSGLREVVKSLVTFGVAFVQNVPPTVEATEKVVENISHVHRTFFGDMWEFSNVMSHSDTAYTTEALGAHTDNTYFTEASGLQVFHCLQHNGEGGETLLVDGFNAAKKLKETHPDSYHRLSKMAIESEFLEPGRHYSCTGPILQLHPVTGELQQIRFNLFDRAPVKTLQADQVMQFYKDLQILANIIADPDGEWWFKLQPGTVVFINNWRILHGRAAYTGHRRMAGCYVGHADWISKARVLGLL
ncbi:trimethyllysine dioxygenase, mitochondrial isoform X2 [Anabrus simplex]|uniref:trimethyllysine dioxygenase, mitochondrial isoform X2 n=1 Tax=Anabrus simplex TaxID=316456 RepID=UPI0034DDA36D